jgi:signal transduction histidine kinase
MIARGLAVALIASLAAAAAAAAAYDADAGLLTFALLAGLGVATVGATCAVLAGRRGVRRTVLLIGAISAGQLVAGVALFVALMFVSSHDAFFVGLAIAYSALLALWAGRVLARQAMADLDTVRTGLAQVGDGERGVRLGVEGEDEIARLAAEVDDMVVRLARTEDARRNLLAAVSHDLRTPITSLRLLVEALDDEVVDSDERAAYLGRLRTHVQALGALIDDLFELSRLESGELRWTTERLALGELVTETVDALQPNGDGGARLVAEVPGDLPVRAAPEQIQRVLFNLIQNAMRHTPDDGSVTVRAEVAGGAVAVEVVDTGEGIAAADRERVFDAFFQGGERSARGEAGAGLGLAISRAIVEAHGGLIALVPSQTGTCVRFTLPSAARDQADPVARV